MKKYIQTYLLKLAEINEYKLNFISKLLRPIITMIVFGVIYSEIFAITKQTTIGGLDKITFLAYIILAVFQRNMVSPWLGGEQIMKSIKSGELTSMITKPIDYVKLQLFNSLANVSMNSFYSITLFLIISFFGHKFFGFYFLNNIFMYLYFFISLILSLFVAHMFYFIIGSLTFWVGDVWSFIDVANIIQQFLSGGIIPLSISATLLNVSAIMPFKSMIYTPVMIYLNQYTLNQIIIEVSQQVIWCIILYFLARIIFKQGLKQFEAQGG
jgi:ABC-2 type transport system permease protein